MRRQTGKGPRMFGNIVFLVDGIAVFCAEVARVVTEGVTSVASYGALHPHLHTYEL